MKDHQDSFDDHNFLDEIVSDDPANRRLAASLRAWRDSNLEPTEPDDRLRSMFTSEPPVRERARWRQWIQRPAIAFAASFAAVFIVGAGAFALVANSGDDSDVAAPTTSALSATEVAAAAGDITLPEDLSEQTSFATCVFDQLTTWFDSGLGSDEAPQIFDECGMPPIPDLGPEADVFRADLQAWANCAAAEVQAILPQLPSLLKGDGDVSDPLDGCGEPPDPRDYGLELPFLDFGEIDPSQFDFGPFNLEDFESKFKEFDLDSFNIEEFLSKIPPGLLPDDINIEDLDLEELKKLFGDFDLQEFDFGSCEGAGELPDVDSLENLEDFDFSGFFAGLEGCGLGFFGDIGDLDLSTLFSHFEDFDIEGLEDLDIESLLGSFSLQDLDGLDLDQLLAELFGDEELDLGSLFEQFADQNT
ncbi:MAG: hypothetical protein HKN91_02165 [Acidimicrobiia bacterium]|nr:hypothetical protein [Acidimicrobiia bacterium]